MGGKARPKDIVDATVDEWTGDLSKKIQTLKGLDLDKHKEEKQHTVRKVLVAVLEELLLQQETKEYHDKLAAEKADALAPGKKAAGAALSAVRQKRQQT